jgi:hypothetical protein
MKETDIWAQMGISPERYNGVVSSEISSIMKTNETVATMMAMVKGNGKMNNDEKYYAAFMVAKDHITRKLLGAMPAMGRGMMKRIMEE